MKITFKLIIIFFLGIQFLNAQNYQTIEEINDACAQLGFASDEDAEIAVDNILDKIGLFRNFTIQECPEINNAVAKNIDIGSGVKERYILYDNEFFNKIDEKANNNWAATSILAHEIGHHLNGHSLNDEGSNHKFELEADEFSGFVLARMGGSLNDAQSAINTLKYEKATSTHPSKADRLVAIEIGWNRGSGKKIEVPKVEIPHDVIVVEEEETKDVVLIDEGEIVDGKLVAEQVLLNYINAIGGQEKIMEIKTLKKNSKTEAKVVMDIAGKETVSNTNIDIDYIYLSPSKFQQTTRMSTINSNVEQLFIDEKLYSKKTSGEWGMTASPLKDHYSLGSYIPEYSLLIRNSDIEFLGVKNFEGKAYNAIKLPDWNTETLAGGAVITSVTSQINYYSVETSLLHKTEMTIITKTDYEINSEYLKDSEAIMIIELIHLNYKPVNGVLFSFTQKGNTAMTGENFENFTESITENTDILVNDYVDKEIFNINNKKVFDQDVKTKNDGEASTRYLKGLQLLLKNECSEGIKLLKESADLDEKDAANIIGQLYDNTYYNECKSFLPKDTNQAVKYYLIAADYGNVESQKKIASFYENGNYGLAKNKEKAIRYYLKSTRSLLWNMVDPSVFKSINGLKKSVDLNESELDYLNALKEMSKGDKAASRSSLLRAAEGGNVDAQVALGYVFLMDQKLEERAKWLKKASEQGDEEAKYLLNQF